MHNSFLQEDMEKEFVQVRDSLACLLLIGTSYISRCLTILQIHYGLKSQPWTIIPCYPQKDSVFLCLFVSFITKFYYYFLNPGPIFTTLNRLLLCILSTVQINRRMPVCDTYFLFAKCFYFQLNYFWQISGFQQQTEEFLQQRKASFSRCWS